MNWVSELRTPKVFPVRSSLHGKNLNTHYIYKLYEIITFRWLVSISKPESFVNRSDYLKLCHVLLDAAEESTTPASFLPHVVLFFQGEIEEIDRIRAYVRLRIPVIILNGCGGTADVLAFAVQNASVLVAFSFVIRLD